jgi:DNA helicase-2/ATP-dependent DNA helicase PcrA
MMSFAEKIFELTVIRDDMGISEFVEFILNDLGMIAEYKAKDNDEDRARIENLKEFVSVAAEFEKDAMENVDIENTFTAFLENIALSTDMDKSDNEENSVTMMTIHNSKGLEFPVVFVVGMEDGIFPSSRSVEEGSIDEERRLCYVAITRARKKLYLTHASSRMQYGKTNMNFPSRFLREIPREYLEESTLYGTAQTQSRNYGYGGEFSFGRTGSKDSFTGQSFSIPKKSAAENKPVGFGRTISTVSDVERLAAAKMAAQNTGDRDFSVGDSVAHAKFGEGIITKMEPSGNDTVVEIQFERVGMKRFSLAYTKLKKI